MSGESYCFISTSSIAHTKVDTVYPAKRNNIHKLCPWMHHARRKNTLNINFLALMKAEIQTHSKTQFS